MFENLILRQPADAPQAEVVYLHQSAKARRARKWQTRRYYPSMVAPFYWWKSYVYGDMVTFADAEVVVEEEAAGQVAHVKAGAAKRPLFMASGPLAHVHAIMVIAIVVVYICMGWPKMDHCTEAVYTARALLMFLLLQVNSILY